MNTIFTSSASFSSELLSTSLSTIMACLVKGLAKRVCGDSKGAAAMRDEATKADARGGCGILVGWVADVRQDATDRLWSCNPVFMHF